LTDGVEMLGVVTPGVPTCGTETVPTVTGGVVTDGTVTAGTVTVGTETVGTLTVGTETVGTLIVGTDAPDDATGSSSAAQAVRTAITFRRTGGRTSHRSPPDPSATEGLDIAHRLRTGHVHSAREPHRRLPHARPSSATGAGSVHASNRKVV
jgi:hypothetical protein